ncbi:hypothetical protein PLESTF_001749800 [Pleodorina starrii]|nr:hypothetical protein PLESTF_001749800 [Pleodorina starrii]
MLKQYTSLGCLIQRIALPSSLSSTNLLSQHSLWTTGSACEAVTREATSVDRSEQPSSSGRGAWMSDKPNWDWKWVLGKSRGRKPAIKQPRRHQWYFCNPNYDPTKPLPVAFRSPYAPPSAYEMSDQAEYQRHMSVMPPKGRDLRSHRKEFARFQKLRELDWREAFQRGVAEDLRLSRKAERREADAKRQEAWRQYKAALFERARLSGEQGELPSVSAGAWVL